MQPTNVAKKSPVMEGLESLRSPAMEGLESLRAAVGAAVGAGAGSFVVDSRSTIDEVAKKARTLLSRVKSACGMTNHQN